MERLTTINLPVRLSTAARHLALLLFASAVAVAAWPRGTEMSWLARGRLLSFSLDAHRLVAAATEVAMSGAAHNVPAPPHFLPAGVVVERSNAGAGLLRVTMPKSVAVTVPGLLWLALLPLCIPRNRGQLPRQRPSDARESRTRVRSALACELSHRVGTVWAMRWAGGATAVAAAMACVYTLPRDAAVMPYTEAQVLHVAGAAVAVCLATMLIAFD